MPRKRKKPDLGELAAQSDRVAEVLASVGIDLDLPYPDEWASHVPPDVGPEFAEGGAFVLAFLGDRLEQHRKKLGAAKRARYTLDSDEHFGDDRMVAPPTIGE
jgi:hypothetical protein